MDELKRKQKVQKILKATYPKKHFKFIGSGYEAVIFTDFAHIYKVFDTDLANMPLLLKQLIGRFKGCRRLFDLEELLDVGGLPVIKYIYKESKPYTGGREDEVIEFLVECWERGIVLWDVKPLNFQIFEDGIRLIDYGRDIKPFNYKDFVFMAQRAFLMLKYSDRSSFKPLVREALKNWEVEELAGFVDFFNKVYSKILCFEKEKPCLPPVTLFNDEMLFKQIWETLPKLQYDEKILLYSSKVTSPSHIKADKERIIHVTDINLFQETGFYETAIVDITGIERNLPIVYNILAKVKKIINDSSHCAVVLKNPYFHGKEGKHPLTNLQRLITNAGFFIEKIEDTKWQIDPSGDFYSQYMIIKSRARKNHGSNVSLMIKTCYQDGPALEKLVHHIVHQLEGPDRFLEKIIVLDPKEDDFLRQFGMPDKELTLKTLDKLLSRGIIDKYFIAPTDPNIIKEVNQRWFALHTELTHSVTNVPVFPQLYAFEQCMGDYILQVDSDAIIVRRDPGHSFLKDMKAALQNNEKALSVSFNIAHHPDTPVREYTSPGNGHFVPEVRFCLIHRERFFQQRPYPNTLVNGQLELTWYRSVEKAQAERGLVSLRGGDPRTFYIHPPNEYKKDLNKWFFIMDRAESGHIPEIQFENVDLQGKFDDWNIPKRNEPFIFIMCARNLAPSKFLRCWQSVLGQTMENWGAIIIDDGSDNCLPEFISFLTNGYKHKVTYIRNNKRKGVLSNINKAIRDFCINPYSIIIILDADDMLLSNDVLLNLNRHYLKGADMTVGSMLRINKGIIPYVPDFKNPRNKRGGDVWMHLRTFRKYLFDRIDLNDFKRNGQWIDKFTELTYMIPISEMAAKPVHIKFPVYLWEPQHVRNDEHYRKNRETIEYIMAKPRYSIKNIKMLDEVKPPGEILKDINSERQIIFIRHAEKQVIEGMPGKRTQKNVDLTENGFVESNHWGASLPVKIDLILVSPTLRTVQTAENIRKGNASDCEIIVINELREMPIINYDEWQEIKNEVGWIHLIKKWINNEIPDSIIMSYAQFMNFILKEIMENIEKKNAEKVLVITHDHIMYVLSAFFLNSIPQKLRYLNGFVIEKRDLNEKLELSETTQIR
ncbi:glycosyltransferase [Methanosarcina sp. KYL-1]|uniref:glycosyltransferase n=1 Tax=Methanosarcina sp. KYL-1 TaxID=2602068 RepID=UPI0021016E7D|nr:glycosyltransferase [Methanosarcina sp. KYL-1]MCQ1537134.1 glycosyltransferase [Methanosarcina sp. KYL-1]